MAVWFWCETTACTASSQEVPVFQRNNSVYDRLFRCTYTVHRSQSRLQIDGWGAAKKRNKQECDKRGESKLLAYCTCIRLVRGSALTKERATPSHFSTFIVKMFPRDPVRFPRDPVNFHGMARGNSTGSLSRDFSTGSAAICRPDARSPWNLWSPQKKSRGG